MVNRMIEYLFALILTALARKTDGETFFAVGDHHYSVAEIAHQTVQYIGSGNVKFVEWPTDRKSAEVGDAIISNKRIKEALNWTPRCNMKDGLTATKKYFENCLDKYLR